MTAREDEIVSEMVAKVVMEARAWLGTPYRHQASLRGAGCDCLGLVRGVWRAVVGGEPEVPPPYTPDWDESGRRELLWQGALRHLDAVPAGAPLAPGQVLLFRMAERAVAKHLGIATQAAPVARFVHAYRGHGVVETTLSDPWRRKIVARFTFPERSG